MSREYWATTLMIDEGDYDTIVTVTAGVYRGRVGFYDDDGDHGAIVYFGPPIFSPYHEIPYKHLRYATAAEREQYKAEHLNDIATERAFRNFPRPK